MKIPKEGIVFLSFILSVLSHADIGILPGGLLLGEVVKWSEDYWNYVKTGYLNASLLSQRFGDTCYREKKYTNAITGRVIQVIPQITHQLTGLSSIMSQRSLSLTEQMKELKLELVIHTQLSRLVEQMGVIDGLYEELNRSISTQKIMEFKGAIYCAFATRQLYTRPLSQEVDAMYNIVLPSKKLLEIEWLNAIHEKLQPYQETSCGLGHSTLDYFHSIYASLIITEIKAYVIAAFSHNLLYNFNGNGPQCDYGENPDEAMSKVKNKLYEHIRNYNQVFSQLMKGASREFRACDRGQDFIRDETFLELEGAIQRIIHHPPHWFEILINSEVFGGKDCTSFNNRRMSDVYCDDKLRFCTTPAAGNCLGKSYDCANMPMDVEACLAPKDTSRRYEWFEERSWFGRKRYTECAKDRKMYIKYRDGPPGCYCNCIDNTVDSLSTHVFNLQWVESDVSENMVITGIRFIVKHRVMQLQIQQGKLGPHFEVEKPEWKPVNDISEAIRASRLNKQYRGKWPDLVENRDYFILNIKDAINFDTLNVSYPNILTGVRFYHRPENPDNHRRIQIEIKGTKFNYMTGKLYEDSIPETVTSTKPHTTWYPYNFDPTKPSFPTKQTSSSGQYAIFDRSHEQTDLGQTTLPLFDALPLVSNPPTPLGGLGIFHKSSKDFTGLISLKFLSLDYPTYMEKSNLDE